MWCNLGMVRLVKLRLAEMLPDWYFSAFDIEKTDLGTDNLEESDLIISGTSNDTSNVLAEVLSKNAKKRKYHLLYSNSVMFEWMNG